MKERIRLAATLALLFSAASAFAGSVLWRQTLDGGAPDEGMGIKTDAAGNAYAAWMTYLAPRAWLMLAKFDANGEEQWRASLPVATAGPPESRSCAIQVVGGDTYVLCREDSADRLAFLTRVATDGSVGWTASLVDFSPQAFEAGGAAVYLSGTNSAGDIVIQQFNGTGLSWTLPVSNAASAGHLTAIGQLVVIGNDVLVTGWHGTDEIDFQTDDRTNNVNTAFVLRAGTDGSLQWLRSLSSTNRLNTFGSGITRTADGSVVLVGSQSRHDTNGVTEFHDNLFVRFDPAGSELMRTSLPKSGSPSEVLPLASGDVLTIATGVFAASANSPLYGETRIARVSTDGVVQWVRVRRLPGGSTAPVARMLDGERLLVGGYDFSFFGRNSLRNLFLLEISTDTGKARHKSLGVPRGTSRHFSQPRDFDLDALGNLYFLTGDGTPWPNVIAVKYRGLGE